MNIPKHQKGKMGEAYIAKMLKKRGFRICALNFRCRFGEIDIIAENAQYIVFVEVKTREQGALVSPFEAVTKGKQQKIIRTANWYLSEKPTERQPRFDVAAVYTWDDKIVDFSYLENAFMLS